MRSVMLRLGRALLGTALLVAGLLIVVIPAPILAKLAMWQSLSGLFLKVLAGALVFALGMTQYEKAAFPPGAAIEDPVSLWMHTKLEQLKDFSWPLYAIAWLVLMFSPFLTVIFLPMVLLRPFYAAFTAPERHGEVLVQELRRTVRYLFEMGKGIFILAACAAFGMVACITTLAGLYFLHRP